MIRKNLPLIICLAVIVVISVAGIICGTQIKEPYPFRELQTQETEGYYVDEYDSIYKLQQKRFKD